jgi:hypothetical protein
MTDSTREEERPFSAEWFVGGGDERRQTARFGTACFGTPSWACTYRYWWVSPESPWSGDQWRWRQLRGWGEHQRMKQRWEKDLGRREYWRREHQRGYRRREHQRGYRRREQTGSEGVPEEGTDGIPEEGTSEGIPEEGTPEAGTSEDETGEGEGSEEPPSANLTTLGPATTNLVGSSW